MQANEIDIADGLIDQRTYYFGPDEAMAEVDTILTDPETWAAMPESSDRRWNSVCTDFGLVLAVRLVT